MYHLTTIRIGEFENMLREHRFAVTIDDPREFRHALKQESRLQRIALNGDSRYIDMFHLYQKKALEESATSVREQETSMYNETSYRQPDTNIDFLDFRSKVRNFDWEYNHQQDRVRYNTGKKELNEIRSIAIERGGEFMRFWKEECAKRNLHAFTRSQNAILEVRKA